MSNSVNISCQIRSIGLLVEAIGGLGLAIQDLTTANQELQKIENCNGESVHVDYILKNEVGEQIGIRQNSQGSVEFVVQKETITSKETINRATQAYSRLKILNEVKKKGYQSIKEEKLPNGSIRLVVEKWR